MKRCPPIGVDLGAHSIKAVQFDPGGGVVAAADIARQDPSLPINETDIVHLRGVLYRRGFMGSRIVLGAPKSMIQRVTLDLPPLESGAPIEQIAQSELCRQRELLPGSFEFRWHESPQPPRHASGARAVTELCTHQSANSLLDLIEAQGFDPVALHSQSTAYAALATSNGSAATVAVVDLGWSDATILTARRGEVRFIRAVSSAGLGALVGSERWLAESLGDALRDALIEGDSSPLAEPEFETLLKRYRASVGAEIRSSVEYLEGCNDEEVPSTLIVLGGGSVVPGVREDLIRIVGRPEPADLVDISAGIGIAGALASSGSKAIPSEDAEDINAEAHAHGKAAA